MNIATGQTESPETLDRKWFRFSLIPFIFLIFFSALIAVDRFAIPKVPLNVDPASYAVVSHELLLGQSLYTDIWDHKPPAIFIVYGAFELVFGYSLETITILNIFVSLIVLFGIYYAGKVGSGGRTAGLWAAAIWVVFSGTFQLEGRDPNTEPFLNACLVLAFALLAKHRDAGLAPGTSISIGILFLLGSLFKPVVVAIAFFLILGHVLISADRRQAIRDSIIIGSVGVVGWIASFLYFAATGRLEIYYESVITYNRLYSGNMWANLIAPFKHEAELLPDFLNLLALFAVAGIVLSFYKNRRQAVLLTAFIGSSWIAIALPGRFSVHYFQLWLPPLIIGASWAIGSIAEAKNVRIRLFSYLAGAVLLITLILGQVSVYQTVFANKWIPFIALLEAGNETAFKINHILEDGETFFAWGNTPTLYVLTQRRPPTPVLFHLHFEENPLKEKLVQRVKTGLEQNRPELLIVEHGRPPIPDWLAKDYETEPIFQVSDTYSFFIRLGGRISKETDLSPGK